MIDGDLWKRCFERAPVGLLLFDAVGEITAANAAATLMLNLHADLAQADSAFTFLDPVFGDTVAALPTADAPSVGPLRCRVVQDTGKVVETEVELHWLDTHCYLASLLDLTPRETDGASIDALTGLLTAAGLRQRLLALRDASRSGDTDRALLIMAVDNLPPAGDELAASALLVASAGYLRRSLRTSDLLARWSQDSFAVVLMHADIGSAQQVAEGLARGLAALEVRSGGRSVTAPVVTAVVISCDEDVDERLALAAERLLLERHRQLGVVVVE